MSSAPLRVFLTITEEKTLFGLSKAKGVPQRRGLNSNCTET